MGQQSVKFMDVANLDTVSEVLNIASGWTKLKILLPFVMANKLITISQFGAEHIAESLIMDDNLVIKARMEGINRLIDVMRQIIEGSYFALKPFDKELVSDYLKKVDNIEAVLPAIRVVNFDARNNEASVSINEEHFSLCLTELRKILKELAIPLNNNSLIFPSSDELDLDKIKNELIFGG